MFNVFISVSYLCYSTVGKLSTTEFITGQICLSLLTWLQSELYKQQCSQQNLRNSTC